VEGVHWAFVSEWERGLDNLVLVEVEVEASERPGAGVEVALRVQVVD